MGNTTTANSEIKIQLTNRSIDDPIYFFGENVECIVQFTNTKQHSNLKLDDAYVELVGQSLHTTMIMQVNADGTTTMMPSDTQVPFFNERRSLLSELTQVKTNAICKAGISDQWSFSFPLPDNLPPSVPPTIVYCIRVVLDMTHWYQRNISHFIPITVYPRTHIPNHLYHPFMLDSENRKGVHLHVTIPQCVISPGTRLPIQYDLNNPKQSTIEGIVVKLNQCKNMGKSMSSKTAILKMDVPNVYKFRGEQLHDQFEITIPTERLPPTLFFKPLNNDYLLEFDPISITYELEMEVKSHGISTNFTLTFSMTMNTNLESSSPPSYESAIKSS